MSKEQQKELATRYTTVASLAKLYLDLMGNGTSSPPFEIIAISMAPLCEIEKIKRIRLIDKAFDAAVDWADVAMLEEIVGPALGAIVMRQLKMLIHKITEQQSSEHNNQVGIPDLIQSVSCSPSVHRQAQCYAAYRMGANSRASKDHLLFCSDPSCPETSALCKDLLKSRKRR
jgi:hypothetical protein